MVDVSQLHAPIPLFNLLDVRTDRGSMRIQESVWIPIDELPERVAELPPKYVPLSVVDLGPDASAAKSWLEGSGRQVTLETNFVASGEESRGRLWQVNPLLEEFVEEATSGRALDLGCGTGRDAVYLACAGFEVHAIDHLPEALATGEKLAIRFGQPGKVNWINSDLKNAMAKEIQQVDVIVCFFTFDTLAISAALTRANRGATVLIETFTPEHRIRTGKPADPSRTLSADQVPTMFPGLKVISVDLGDRASGANTIRVRATVP